jgi:hypothetical protein
MKTTRIYNYLLLNVLNIYRKFYLSENNVYQFYLFINLYFDIKFCNFSWMGSMKQI